MGKVLIAKNSIKGLKPNGEYTKAGEKFITDALTALELLAAGAAEEVAGEDEGMKDPHTATMSREDVLIMIRLATKETLESLRAEIPEDDEELVEAFATREAELDELDH